MSSPKHDRSFGIAVFCCVVLVLLIVYVGSYCALLGEPVRRLADPFDYLVLMENDQRADHYRYGGEAAEYFFWPINQVDRLIRRGYWTDPFSP